MLLAACGGGERGPRTATSAADLTAAEGAERTGADYPAGASADDAAAAGAGYAAAVGAEHAGPAGARGPTPAAPKAFADPRFANADLGRGEVLSYACRACHSLAAGEESPIGPPLHGVFGRPAGAVPGFEYSRALRESGIVWTPEALDAWLSAPADFLPGNAMAFAGFHSAEDRRDLIAYLLEETSRPAQR